VRRRGAAACYEKMASLGSSKEDERRGDSSWDLSCRKAFDRPKKSARREGLFPLKKKKEEERPFVGEEQAISSY